MIELVKRCASHANRCLWLVAQSPFWFPGAAFFNLGGLAKYLRLIKINRGDAGPGPEKEEVSAERTRMQLKKIKKGKKSC